jgi:hypothetical protein
MEEKNLYREKFEAKLKELKAQIDVIEAKAAQVKAESKIEYQKQMEELRRKREAVGHRLEEIKIASGEAWKDLKGGMEKGMDDLKQGIDQAMDRFR